MHNFRYLGRRRGIPHAGGVYFKLSVNPPGHTAPSRRRSRVRESIRI